MSRKLLCGVGVMFMTLAGMLFISAQRTSAFTLHGDKAPSAPHHKQRRHTNTHVSEKHGGHHKHGR
jgi:hypothetical protein